MKNAFSKTVRQRNALAMGYMGPTSYTEAARENFAPTADGFRQAIEIAANSQTPVISDVASGLLAADDVRRGNYGIAGLNALGALPLVPALGMVTRSHLDDLLKAMNDAPRGGSFGLRVIPEDVPHVVNVGDVLPPSYRWVDGVQTDRALRGTSTIGVKKGDEQSLIKAFDLLGVREKPNPLKGYYPGEQVVLVHGKSKGRGTDLGEVLIDNPSVVWRGVKKSSGQSDLK